MIGTLYRFALTIVKYYFIPKSPVYQIIKVVTLDDKHEDITTNIIARLAIEDSIIIDNKTGVIVDYLHQGDVTYSIIVGSQEVLYFPPINLKTCPIDNVVVLATINSPGGEEIDITEIVTRYSGVDGTFNNNKHRLRDAILINNHQSDQFITIFYADGRSEVLND
jgi:hypothetical protein